MAARATLLHAVRPVLNDRHSHGTDRFEHPHPDPGRLTVSSLAGDRTAAHPTDQAYVWTITGPDGPAELGPVRIGGPEGRTEIPALTTIAVSQANAAVTDLAAVDPERDVTFSWGPFAEGAPLEGSMFDDLHFLLVDNCFGETVFTGGAPGGEKDVITDFTVTEVTLPAGAMKPGMDYVFFMSRVNFRDFDEHGMTWQTTANSFAIELPFRTAGTTPPGRTCPQPHWRADYRFSRKSPEGAGMVPWPTVQEIAERERGATALKP